MATEKTPAKKPAAKTPAKKAEKSAAKPDVKPTTVVVRPAAKAVSKPVVAKARKEKTSGMATEGRTYGTGRRKDAVARVWIAPGRGKISINGKELEQYFARPVLRMIINQPFAVIDRVGSFDVVATVLGGGLSGQAGAIRHGISRALDQFEDAFHKPLRQGGFLTRDSRVVERKKYGRKKARRSFQFSKR